MYGAPCVYCRNDVFTMGHKEFCPDHRNNISEKTIEAAKDEFVKNVKKLIERNK